MTAIIIQGELFNGDPRYPHLARDTFTGVWATKRDAMYYLAAWSIFGAPKRSNLSEFVRVLVDEPDETRLNLYFTGGFSGILAVYFVMMLLRFAMFFKRLYMLHFGSGRQDYGHYQLCFQSDSRAGLQFVAISATLRTCGWRRSEMV